MLKRLILKNYKCYKDLDIEFSDKITAIYGLSTHGKTAILNAIKLMSTLRPNGAKYISTFAKNKKANMSMEFSNGKVDFEKTKTQAQYILNDDEENKFTHLNKKVPEEVLDFIKIDEDNFSFQFDGPFLIFSPNSVISKKINESIGIERWDLKLKEINKEINDSKKQIKNTIATIKEHKRVLKKIDNIGLDNLDLLIKKRDKLKNQINDDSINLQYIINCSEILNKHNTESISKKISKAEILFKRYQKIETLIASNKNLSSCVHEYLSINIKLDSFIDVSAFETKLKSLFDDKEVIEASIKENKSELSKVNEFKVIQDKILELNKKIIKLNKEKKEFTICPECGQSLDKI